MSEPAVVARALVKRYGELCAVNGVDFEIRAGECFGFLGPNGAGKTSTMRMMQAVATPTSGTLTVLGLDVARDGKRVRRRIGVCPQEDNLDVDLRVRDNLIVYGGYFGMARAEREQRADELLAFVSLEDRAGARVPELSGGMKRRLTIARALVSRPELLILDEPTTGLDPQARQMLWHKLRELKGGGVTMVLSTHYMEEAERLCDRLVIMDRGRILTEGAPAELVDEHVGREVVELHASEADQARVLDGLELAGVGGERTDDTRALFFRGEDARVAEIGERARRAGVPFLARRAGLEDVFLQLTGRELDE
jgi:lipooligosaccharide transport system ATP-binding protein